MNCSDHNLHAHFRYDPGHVCDSNDELSIWKTNQQQMKLFEEEIGLLDIMKAYTTKLPVLDLSHTVGPPFSLFHFA